MTTTTNDATILLRLPADLKAALTRAAAANGRRITSEVNLRLKASFDAPQDTYPSSAPTVLSTAHAAPIGIEAKDKSPADLLTELDRAMLGVFRRMPPEKQLALLSLFR